MLSFTHYMTILQLCHFTNQAQGDRRDSKLMNFTKELILYVYFGMNTKRIGFLMELGICINFWNKITKRQGYCTNKIDMTHVVKITIGLRYQRDPFVVSTT